MLLNDKTNSTSVSEAVEKIPTDEKDYANAPLCVLEQGQTNIQLTVEIVACQQGYIQYSEKKSQKTFYIKSAIKYTEKGAITAI